MFYEDLSVLCEHISSFLRSLFFFCYFLLFFFVIFPHKKDLLILSSISDVFFENISAQQRDSSSDA